MSNNKADNVDEKSLSPEKEEMTGQSTATIDEIALKRDNINATTPSDLCSKNDSQQRKRKSCEGNFLTGEASHKIAKNSSDYKDSDSMRLQEALTTLAKTLVLLTQVCNRAVNTHPDFLITQQPIRTARTLSSTLAAAVRVASALSSTSTLRSGLSNDDLSDNLNPCSKSQDKTSNEQNEDTSFEVATSTPKKQCNNESVKIDSPSKDSICQKNIVSDINSSIHDDNSSVPERRVTRKSSQNK